MSDQTLSIKTIVVCIDFTAASDLALRYARRFADHWDGKLVLVHIVDSATISPEEMDAHLALHNIIDSAKADMQTISAGLTAENVKNSWIVRHGNVRDMILEVVRDNHADLMVLGSKGTVLSGRPRFGTIAEQLVRASPCPVLTVVPEARWQELEDGHQRLLVVPTNFSAASQAAFLYALAFAKSVGGSLLLVHAVDYSFAAEPIAEELAELRSKDIHTLLESARAANVKAESLVRTGDASELVLQIARERQADCIVMGVRGGDQVDGTRLLGRVQGLMHRSPCPLISIYLPGSHRIVSPKGSELPKSLPESPPPSLARM